MGSSPSAPTDPRPSLATPPYHRKCQMFLSTDKRAGVLHDLIQDYPGSCKWTSMRRHCLSSRRGGWSLWQRRNCSCPSRYASIRTFDEPTFGGSVHRMRSVLIRALLRRGNLPSGLFSCRMGQVHMRSHLWRSEARSGQPCPSTTLGSSLPLCQLPSPPLLSFTVSWAFGLR